MKPWSGKVAFWSGKLAFRSTTVQNHEKPLWPFGIFGTFARQGRTRISTGGGYIHRHMHRHVHIHTVYICTYTYYIRIHTHMYNIYTLLTYIYMYNLHIHIGTITISGGRGGHHQTLALGHIYFVYICIYKQHNRII